MVALSTKISGPLFTCNTTNMSSGNTIGGATMLRTLNTSTGFVTITVANNGVNVGSVTLLANNIEYISKYASDLVFCSNTGSLVQFTPVATSW
jgi:hypothetical protein